MNKKVLAVSNHPGGANAISPVVPELIKSGVEVVALDCGASDIFKQYKISLTPLSAFGIDAPTQENLEKVIVRENVGLVISGTSIKKPGAIEHAAVKAATSTKCPSIAVLDLWMNYRPRFEDKATGQLVLPTVIAVMDDIARDGMIAEGFPPEKLRITGNPYFDSLNSDAKKFDATQREILRGKLGIKPGERMASFFSQPIEQDFGKNGGKYGFTEKDALGLFLETAELVGDAKPVKVRVYVHPRERAVMEQQGKEFMLIQIAEEHKKKGLDVEFTDKDIRARPLILASDLTATAFSTSAYESIAMGVPAVAVMPNATRTAQDETFIPKFERYIPIATDRHGLYGTLYLLLTDGSHRSSVQERLKEVKVDGRATERVKDLALELVK